MTLTMLQFNSLPRHIVKRLAYGTITVIAVVVTLVLLAARDRALVRAQGAAVLNSWQTAQPLAGGPLTADALYARFGIKQASANSEMNWQVASVSELRASLIAFDLAQIRLTQVKITRSGAGFVVTAERAP